MYHPILWRQMARVGGAIHTGVKRVGLLIPYKKLAHQDMMHMYYVDTSVWPNFTYLFLKESNCSYFLLSVYLVKDKTIQQTTQATRHIETALIHESFALQHIFCMFCHLIHNYIDVCKLSTSLKLDICCRFVEQYSTLQTANCCKM